MNEKIRHKYLEESLKSYVDWYVQFLLDNGFHPSRKERMKVSGRDSTTLQAWESEISGRGWAEKVNRGLLGTILLFPGVYFVDNRKVVKNDLET